MSTDYLDSNALKASLDLTNESFADADVSLAITAASRALDNLCHRRFWLDADANQQRYYAARSRRLLEIDDLTVFTALDTDENGDGVYEHNWAPNSDFVLEPVNAAGDDGAADGEPFTAVRRHPHSMFSLPARMPRGVRVTGQFGWPEIPAAIQEATGILAARLMRRAREAPFGVIGFAMEATSAVHLARQDPDVTMLASSYIRLPTAF